MDSSRPHLPFPLIIPCVCVCICIYVYIQIYPYYTTVTNLSCEYSHMLSAMRPSSKSNAEEVLTIPKNTCYEYLPINIYWMSKKKKNELSWGGSISVLILYLYNHFLTKICVTQFDFHYISQILKLRSEFLLTFTFKWQRCVYFEESQKKELLTLRAISN